MHAPKVIIILVLFLLIVYCAPPPRNNVVKIGIVISPDEYGLNVLKGAQLAVKEAELANVRFFVEKSACDTNNADSVAEKLIFMRKVQVIVEGVCSDLATGLAPLAAENNVVMISAVSSASALSATGMLRTIPSDTMDAMFAADLLVQKKQMNAAIMHLNEEIEARDAFAQKLASQNARMVRAESFEKNSIQFETQLEVIADSEATALYSIPDSSKTARLLLKQRQERAISIPVYGSKWFKTDDVLGLGNAANGLTIISPRLGNIGFITKYTEEYGIEPGLFSAQGYDAYKALALVIVQGARNSDEMREALLKVEFIGASGFIDFNEQGDVGANVEVYVVEDGKFELQ